MSDRDSNVLDMLNNEFGQDAEYQVMLAEERVNALAARLIYDARKQRGLTQQQLAQLVGTHQSVIARLEDSDYRGHTLFMLERIGKALGLRTDIRFVVVEQPEQNPDGLRHDLAA